MTPWLAALLLTASAQDDSGARPPAWTKVASPTTDPLTAASFVNARLGWALGMGGTVLRTADGGATWTVQRQGGKPERSRPFEHLRFEDDRRGWIAQCCSECDLAGIQPVAFFSTEDGGATWTQTEKRFDSTRLVDRDGPKTANGDRIFRSHQRNVCFVRDDPEDIHIANKHPALAPFGTYSVTDYDDVAFGSATAGVLVGHDTKGPLLLRTEDGGRRWERVELPGLRAGSIRRAVMSGPTSVRIVPSESASIWASRDGGKTWKAEWTGTAGEQVKELLFPAPGAGVAIGEDGLILRYAEAKK